MIMSKSSRAGVIGVLASAALALTATPALAADTDFGVDLRSATIAADASGKWPHVNLDNHGTTKPSSFVVVFDGTELDQAKVTLVEPGEWCEAEAGIVTCTVTDAWSIPGPGESTNAVVPLKKVEGAKGAAGKLTVTVKVEGDTVTANDSRTAAVSIGGHGADISVFASDVTWQDENGAFTHEGVPPGEVAPFFPYIVNQGDATADGIRVRATLPKQVTFTDRQYENCEISRDRRTLECNLEQYPLAPKDEEDAGGGAAGMFFTFEVRVSKDAKGPVALPGGTIVASAIAQSEPASAQRAAATPELPDYVRWMTDAELAKVDVDPADNKDDFAVVVRGPAPGEDDGDEGDDDGDDDDDGDGDNGGGGGGGQGGGGGLPVTGPGALGIAGAGLGAIAAGAMLLIVTRRRRVVQE